MSHSSLSRRGLLTSLTAGGGLAAAGSAGAQTQTPVQQHGWLQVKGNRIVGEHGRPVVLRGMSLFWSQWQGKYYNADAVRWLKDDWKANVVRAAIGVDSGGYIAHPAAEMAKAEAVIQAAIDLGIYVIVDWHAHEVRTEAAQGFFGKLAAKYGGYPNVIWETYNEPLPKHGWAKVLKPYHEAVIPQIRRHSPKGLIVAGTRSWSQDVEEAAADPLADPNTAYTLHFYAGTHRQPLRDKALKALSKGAALFVTEWGTSEANGNDKLDDVETRIWWDFMEKHQISYANWSVADKNETSAALRPGAPARGGWTEAQISPSGRLVRDWLRRMNRV